MKKDKLSTEDGSEFTVFYLGDASEKKSDFSSEPNKEDSCCPHGHEGHVGEAGLHIDPEKLSDFSSEPNKPKYMETEWKYGEPDFNQIHGQSGLHIDPEKLSDYYEEPNKECIEEENFYEDPFGNFINKASEDPENWKHIKKFLSEGKLKAITDIGKAKIQKFLDDDLDNYLDKAVIIDDTIKQDIVSNPVSNEIYRVRGMNKVVRFLGYENDYFKVDALVKGSIMEPDKKIVFLLNPKDELLIKATEKDKLYYDEI